MPVFVCFIFISDAGEFMNNAAFSKKYRYGFIGVGNMASAIISGLVNTETVESDNIMMFDISDKNIAFFSSRGCVNASDPLSLCKACRYVFLAVKPYHMKGVLEQIKNADMSGTVFVTIAASVPSSFICSVLGRDVPVIRIMPNTPMLVGKGACAVSHNSLVSDDVFNDFLGDLGKISVVSVMDETLLNPVIAVNGSSPAYVYLFVKAMLDGAEKQGIDAESALPLILCTVEGAVKMIRESGKSIDTLIKEVSSPGGTTLAALSSFEHDGFVDSVVNAMAECTRRADEITAEL